MQVKLGAARGIVKLSSEPQPQVKSPESTVSVSNFVGNLSKWLILPNWLQMVGVLVSLGALAFLPAHGLIHVAEKAGVFVGIGVAVAGRLYNQVYPS